MKKNYILVIASAALYIVALSATWLVCTHKAIQNAERELEVFEKAFGDSINDSIATLLSHTAQATVDYIGNTARPLTTNEAAKIAVLLHFDELNVIDKSGIIIGTTVPMILGSNFHDNKLTAEFLPLSTNASGFVRQQFRNGVHNPNAYRMYVGIGFADNSGFVQLGFDYDRLVKALDRYGSGTFRSWHLGKYGHYDLANAEYLPREYPDNTTCRGYENGERIFFRAFTFAGHRYAAIIPDREYFEPRNDTFAIMAPCLAVVILFLLAFLRAHIRAETAESQRRAAEDAARARDLDMAREIQLSSLPGVLPYRRDILSLTFDAVTRPAKEVGGDFYDFYFLDSSHIAFVIADVAGKGISAAMFMMMAKNEIFNAMSELKNPVNAITEANIRICRKNDADMFVTMLIAVVDIFSGKMVYVNAGHNRPFIRRANGAVEKECGRGGKFLGMFPDAVFQSHRLELHKGDAFFAYTDGITEAMNVGRELYGDVRLTRSLEAAEPDAGKIIAKVDADVQSFSEGAEQSDDFTALAFVWHGAPEKYEREFSATQESIGAAVEWTRGKIELKSKKGRSRLLNAADEIIANVVMYSGAVQFKVSVENAPGRTRVEVSDSGREFNQLVHEDPDIHIPLEKRPIGGLGILMTKRLVDSASYRRESGKNILTLLVSEK